MQEPHWLPSRAVDSCIPLTSSTSFPGFSPTRRGQGRILGTRLSPPVFRQRPISNSCVITSCTARRCTQGWRSRPLFSEKRGLLRVESVPPGLGTIQPPLLSSRKMFRLRECSKKTRVGCAVLTPSTYHSSFSQPISVPTNATQFEKTFILITSDMAREFHRHQC